MSSLGKKFAIALCGFALFGTACMPMQLRQAGYAATNKVWYHWSDQNGQTHKLVVCDVAADGSETNCKESEI